MDTKKISRKKLHKPLLDKQFYCFTCSNHRTTRSNKNLCTRITKNGRYLLTSQCSKCVNKVSKFVSKEVYDKYKKCK